jgi:hypothetical protein
MVLPDGRLLERDAAALENCATVQCIKVTSIIPLSWARANGVDAATAPVARCSAKASRRARSVWGAFLRILGGGSFGGRNRLPLQY